MPKGARTSSSPDWSHARRRRSLDGTDRGEEAAPLQQPRAQSIRLLGRERGPWSGDDDHRAPGEWFVSVRRRGVDARRARSCPSRADRAAPRAIRARPCRGRAISSPCPTVKQSLAFSPPRTLRMACVSARSSRGLTWTSSVCSNMSCGVRNQCLSPLATTTTASVATRPSSARPASRPKRRCRSTS